jgi:hypothetical protein
MGLQNLLGRMLDAQLAHMTADRTVESSAVSLSEIDRVNSDLLCDFAKAKPLQESRLDQSLPLGLTIQELS